MALNFKNVYNKFAQVNNEFNRSINQAIGKDVFKELKEIEEPKEFTPIEQFPEFDLPEPEQWTDKKGVSKEFIFEGNTIYVSEELDKLIQYRRDFRAAAAYYASRFQFKYNNCVQDFDSFVNYFPEIYLEGLKAMLIRAYSVLLPFGIFTVSMEEFEQSHLRCYRRAIDSYETMVGIEKKKNEIAEQSGNLVGNSVQMQGGGFGFKGAMKGAAMAEAFNIGMGFLGKMVANQNKMSIEEKEKVFEAFKQEIFFQEVYSDYVNSFLTMVQTIYDNNESDNIKTSSTVEYNTMIKNLQNPMFPKEKIGTALVTLITNYPFENETYDFLKQKYGETEEIKDIIKYFVGY